jgi:molybdenum-dependent DNA-binding transcriptional regulator ModE
MQWTERAGRRLKLRDLHILLAVVQHRSMAKAATALAISQPAVSKAIGDMENVLGLRLLDRGRYGVEPTAYGLALIKRGRAVFDELKTGVEELRFLADPTVGRRIASYPRSILAPESQGSRGDRAGTVRDDAVSRVARAEHRFAVGADPSIVCGE